MHCLHKFRSSTVLLAVAVVCVGARAEAAGIQAIIGVDETRSRGEGSITLFLNDQPLGVVPEQTVTLDVGDVLRAEVSASAAGAGVPTIIGERAVTVDLVLPASVVSASVRNTFSGSGDSMPESAYGGVGFNTFCDFRSGGCSAPGLPLFTSFTSAVQSSTFELQDNEIVEFGEATPTGRVGGLETLDPLSNVLELAPLSGQPSAELLLRAIAQVLFQASASGAGELSVEVTDIAVVPLPAAAWLFAGALAGLGGLRRRGARRG